MNKPQSNRTSSAGQELNTGFSNASASLHSNESSFVLSVKPGESPRILYWGERLIDPPNLAMLSAARLRRLGDGSASIEAPITLSCEPESGFHGHPGFEVSHDGTQCTTALKLDSVTSSNDSLQIECKDSSLDISVKYDIRVDKESGLFRIQTRVRNDGQRQIGIDNAAVCCIPIDSFHSDMVSFSGRWAREFSVTRAPIRQGGFVSENRRGRTSHDRFPGVVMCEQTTAEQSGRCFGMHLAWSGNHRLRVDKLGDGRLCLQAGELLLPGEVILLAGQSYTSPRLYAGYSTSGLSGLTNQFHDYYRANLADARIQDKPRPVHYNTWEGIYFDHTPATITMLANEAASIGVERFVLDDGWFLGRRADDAGLGDWQVDKAVYPEGLTPVIDHVKSKGMEFGLWVEPEMVNVDSDLYREHPDWILGGRPDSQLPFRHQFVLDMARDEVSENIFRQLDALLRDHDIAYLKWDMNRDLNHPIGADGSPSTHQQTHAVYALLERLRDKHPQVEIESCSSGGGRIDFGILERTDRVWTSDSNDPLDRQSIQRGASMFFPLSVLGAHVGPDACKITHRRTSMSLRAATAMFGHMGVEADLLQLTNEERLELTDAIALYKGHRKLIHGGRFIRLDGDDSQNVVGVVDQSQSQALYSIVQLATNPDNLPGILRVSGLDPRREYTLDVVWPTPERFPHSTALGGPGWESHGPFSGEVLEKVGLQLPLLHPEMCLVYEFKAVN